LAQELCDPVEDDTWPIPRTASWFRILLRRSISFRAAPGRGTSENT
jgi:hypothetical protein